MRLYLRTKFQVSSIFLTSFRVILPPPTSKRAPKKPTQIRINLYVIVKSNYYETPPEKLRIQTFFTK